MSIEQYTRDCVNSDLKNKEWVLDRSDPSCNVTQEESKTSLQKKKIKRKRPDYVLYETNTDNIIAIIEAKHGGYTDLNQALNQAEKYAKLLQSDNRPILLFATNGSIYQTRFFPSNEPLIFNQTELKGLLEEDKLLLFINGNTNNIDTTPKEVIKSKEDLIKIFKNLNDVLRGEGLRAGIERFTEFSNLLFLKLISEHNQKPWWKEIKSNLKGDDNTISYINNHIFKQLQGEYGGDVITPISIKNESTLNHIVNAIDPLVLSTIDTDIKGDAFEYFLEKTTSTENDLGEYFTPRHVVKAIVEFVKPKFNEKIYDPFCGTGGFLTSAFHYIRESVNLNKQEEYNLKNNSLYGNEITATAKTAKMNMILQGDGHSGIQQIDSLFNPIDKKYDLIITNIPFSQKIVKKVIIDGKEQAINEVTKIYENGQAKNSGDAVCVLHCFRALKKAGRMALVVPEGFLFRNTEKTTRRFLLDNSNLEAVISLPQGTFLPYTGVKTSILYFTNVHTPKPQKEFWYYEAKNIGFSLDNHRRPIYGLNDLDIIKSSVDKFKQAKKDEDIKKGLLQDGFQLIDLQKVIDNNYNLIGSCYIENNYCLKFKFVKLKDVILQIKDGGTPPRKKENSIDYFSGNINWCTIKDIKSEIYETKEKLTDIGLKNCSAKVWPINSIIISLGATIGKVGIAKQPTSTKQGISGIIVNQDVIIPKFLYYILKSQEKTIKELATGSTIKEVRPSVLGENLKIPLPPLEQQQEIVNELDSYHKIIDGFQQVIDNWKPQFEIEESWELKKLGDLCEIINGGTPNTKEEQYWNGSVPWVTLIDMQNKYLSSSRKTISTEGLNNSNAQLLPTNSVVLSSRATIGKIAITKVPLATNQGFKSFVVIDKSILDFEYLYYILYKNLKSINNLSSGSTYKEISTKTISNFYIQLPPIKQQQKIVEKIEFERNIIEQNKKLVEIYKEKVADKLNKLFN